jgi:hypothetical protein
MVGMVGMLAPGMPLPIAKGERQRHTRVMEEMHRVDLSKIKSPDMVMGTGPVV